MPKRAAHAAIAAVIPVSGRRAARGTPVAMAPLMISIHPEDPRRAVVVAGVDDSPASRVAVAAAARFGRIPGTEVHLVHVLPSTTGRTGGASAVELGAALLRSLAAEGSLSESAVLHLNVGTPWREIVQLAADVNADVVIVGSRDRSRLDRAVNGSVSEQVIRHARCPVFVSRVKDHDVIVPAIEPPCSACLATQNETKGARLWCERHASRHVRGRLHYGFSSGIEGGSSQFLRV